MHILSRNLILIIIYNFEDWTGLVGGVNGDGGGSSCCGDRDDAVMAQYCISLWSFRTCFTEWYFHVEASVGVPCLLAKGSCCALVDTFMSLTNVLT